MNIYTQQVKNVIADVLQRKILVILNLKCILRITSVLGSGSVGASSIDNIGDRSFPGNFGFNFRWTNYNQCDNLETPKEEERQLFDLRLSYEQYYINSYRNTLIGIWTEFAWFNTTSQRFPDQRFKGIKKSLVFRPGRTRRMRKIYKYKISPDPKGKHTKNHDL